MLSSIYLTGDTIEAQELVGQMASPDWRSMAMTKLQRYGVQVVNPLELTWSGIDSPEIISEGSESRIRRALELIDQCDALLANLNRSSYGTAMEMFYAFRRGKFVTVVGQSPYSPWVLSHSQARFCDINDAIDYIIGEQPSNGPINWALQYEGQLFQRYEQMPPAAESDYKFFGGSLPVLVMAPHATAHWRDGELHECDSFTGSMTAVLNRMSSCHSLLTNYCCAADPCWYLETPFRRTFGDIVKAGQIGLVVLLLGASWHEAHGLQISAAGPNEQSSDDYLTRLKNKLSGIEPVIIQQEERLPLVTFAAETLGVPIVTLKMHKRYRIPRLQPESFMQVVGQLTDFIQETGTELARGLG